MTVVMVEERSGKKVKFGTANLPQSCQFCGENMQGETIVHVEDGPPGWYCFKHLAGLLVFF